MKNKETQSSSKGKFWLRVITLFLAVLMVLGLAFYTVYAIIYQIREGRKSAALDQSQVLTVQVEQI